MKNKEIFLFREHPKDRAIDTERFKYVRAYHACRPDSLSTYLSDGIKPLSKEDALNILKKKLNNRFSEYELSNALEKRWSEHAKDGYNQYCFFSFEKKPLFEPNRPETQHYLIYGSEFIYSVVVSLVHSNYLVQPLLKTGKPTIITCDIPIELIHPEWIRFGEGFKSIDGLRTYPIPKEYIVKIEHPKGLIYDPILCKKTWL